MNRARFVVVGLKFEGKSHVRPSVIDRQPPHGRRVLKVFRCTDRHLAEAFADKLNAEYSA